ncbi:hypothetical protein C0J52_01198 [Blattella germanica]|nr:hypothetical protein C0J52_01198 [Blattella germanica]
MNHYRQLCFLFGFLSVTSLVASSNNLFWWLKDDPKLIGLDDSLSSSEEKQPNSNSDTEKRTQLLPTTLEPRLTTTQDGPNCVCVEYYLCDSNNTIITNGEGGLFDVRFGADDVPSCPGVQVCCKVPEAETTWKPVTTHKPTTAPRIPASEKPPVVCGARGGFSVRIQNDDGDNSTEFAEFPWMLALLKRGNLQDGKFEENIFQCGASLIHPQVALTAAHCVTGRKENTLKIRAGEYDSQSSSEPVPHQEREITRIIRHPDFYSGALYNDIALLILDKPITIVVNAQPICLPQQDAIFDNRRCLATGWGIDAFGKGGTYQTTLKKVELPIVPHDNCQSKLRESRLGQHFRLHQSFICGGGEPGKDTCKGDGGGPLVCYDPKAGAYVQVGIVSWGLACGMDGIPAVYTNVPIFRKWIDEIFEQLGFN